MNDSKVTPVEAQAVPDQPVARNQCDGCARGIPLDNGFHRGPGSWDIQCCTADRYSRPTPAAADLHRLQHNIEVLTNALWKACGDDKEVVQATIESQGELL